MTALNHGLLFILLTLTTITGWSQNWQVYDDFSDPNKSEVLFYTPEYEVTPPQISDGTAQFSARSTVEQQYASCQVDLYNTYLTEDYIAQAGITGVKLALSSLTLTGEDAAIAIDVSLANGYAGFIEYDGDDFYTISIIDTTTEFETVVWEDSGAYPGIDFSNNRSISLYVKDGKLQANLFDLALSSPVIPDLKPIAFQFGTYADVNGSSAIAAITEVSTTNEHSSHLGQWFQYDYFDDPMRTQHYWAKAPGNTTNPTYTNEQANFSLPGSSNEEGAYLSFLAPPMEPGGFRFDAQLIAAQANSGVEALLNYGDYACWFEIFTDDQGRYYIGAELVDDTTPDSTTLWTSTRIPAQLNTFYTLAVIMSNNQLQFYANGQHLGTTPRYDWLSTPLEIALGTWSEGGSAIRAAIDNVELFQKSSNLVDFVSIGRYTDITGPVTYGFSAEVETYEYIKNVDLTSPLGQTYPFTLAGGTQTKIWEMEIENSANTLFDQFPYGDYILTVTHFNNTKFSTIIPFAAADRHSPLPQPTQVPQLLAPANLNGSTLHAQEVTFNWGNPDPLANHITFELYNPATDLEIDLEFNDSGVADGPLSTRTTGPLPVTPGNWYATISNGFGLIETNADSVVINTWYSLDKYAQFTVDEKYIPVTASVVGGMMGQNGAVTPEQTYAADHDSLTFTATPDEGYRVALWYVDSVPQEQATGNTFVLGNITQATSVEVSFMPITYLVTFNIVGEGSIQTTDWEPITYYQVGYNETLPEFRAVAGGGYQFFALRGDYVSDVPRIYYDGVVTSDLTIEVVFGVDTDHNGLPDSWEQSVSLNGDPVDPEADDDHDGIKNKDEFLHDTNPFTFNIRMEPGWNLIHIPNTLTPEQNNIDALFTGILGDLWQWAPNIQQYIPSNGISIGDGFWVYWDEPSRIISIPGEVASVAPIPLENGWNLIGVIEPTPLTLNPQIKQIIYWDNQTQMYRIHQGQLMPGIGYWIFSEGNSNLTE